MRKIIMYSLFFILMSYGAAFSVNFKATYFWYDPQTGNLETAILVDQDTGNEWVVQKGDVIEGWMIVAITPDYVEIARYLDEQGYVAVHTLYFNDDGPIIVKPSADR